MISERQQEANRRNAAKSHGPITPEGRAAVRHNALKHGFTAAEIILPTVEERIDFEQFRFAFEEEYKPEGPTEQVLVEDMVIARWRLNRIRKMEPGFFALRLEDLKDFRQKYYSNLDGQAHLAYVVYADAGAADTYGKMSRYEGRFERTFYKALKELQRLQALRAAVSDPGNGTVSQSPVSPDPEPPPAPISDPISDPEPAPAPISDPLPDPEPPPPPTAPSVSAGDGPCSAPESRHPKSDSPSHPPQC
jgi:hypothetical protein